MAENNAQKTEKPTPKRLNEARNRGQIPRSVDLVGWCLVLISTFVLPPTIAQLGRVLTDYLTRLGDAVRVGETDAFMSDSGSVVGQVSAVLAPFLILVVVFTAGGLAAQGGVTLSAETMKPKLERLSLKAGVRRLVSTQSAVDTVKAVVRLGVLALLVAKVATGLVASYMNGSSRDLSVVGPHLGASLLLVIRLAAFSGVLVGVADYAYQRRKVGRQLMMSKEEIKQEVRSTEGDPMVRGRRRALHAKLSRNQMLAAVGDASVVMVNPTHVAVALSYSQGSVPKVVAKGGDRLASRIRERAFEAGVPVVEVRPLARVLFDTLEVGAEIPAQMYEAVAIVIAFVMRAPRPAFGRTVRRVNVPTSKLPVDECVVSSPDANGAPPGRVGHAPGSVGADATG
jgi:flagellar biosynthetic protein FlhB